MNKVEFEPIYQGRLNYRRKSTEVLTSKISRAGCCNKFENLRSTCRTSTLKVELNKVERINVELRRITLNLTLNLTLAREIFDVNTSVDFFDSNVIIAT